MVRQALVIAVAIGVFGVSFGVLAGAVLAVALIPFTPPGVPVVMAAVGALAGLVGPRSETPAPVVVPGRRRGRHAMTWPAVIAVP